MSLSGDGIAGEADRRGTCACGGGIRIHKQDGRHVICSGKAACFGRSRKARFSLFERKRHTKFQCCFVRRNTPWTCASSRPKAREVTFRRAFENGNSFLADIPLSRDGVRIAYLLPRLGKVCEKASHVRPESTFLQNDGRWEVHLRTVSGKYSDDYSRATCGRRLFSDAYGNPPDSQGEISRVVPKATVRLSDVEKPVD